MHAESHPAIDGVVVEIDGNEGKVFSGIGPLGLSKRFNWPDITEVLEEGKPAQNPRQYRIIFEGIRRIAFGSKLSYHRRRYILQALRKMLGKR